MICGDFPRRFPLFLARIWLHIILRSVAAAAAAAAVIILAAAAANVAAISLARRDNSFHSFVSIPLFAASDVTAHRAKDILRLRLRACIVEDHQTWKCPQVVRTTSE